MTPPDRALRRRPRMAAVGRALGCGVAFALPVAVLAYVAREKVGAIIHLDETAIRSATDLTRSSPALRSTLIAVQELTQPLHVYLAGTAVCVLVWLRLGYRSRALWAFATMMVAWNIALDIKLVVQRARPVVADPVSHAPGYSFPSGHAANAAAAATVMVLLLWPAVRASKARYAVPLALAAVVAVTAADRVFLGVHFPSDVVAGVLVGAGLAVASFVGYRGWNPDRPTVPPRA